VTVLTESELESNISDGIENADKGSSGDILADTGPQQMSLGDY